MISQQLAFLSSVSATLFTIDPLSRLYMPYAERRQRLAALIGDHALALVFANAPRSEMETLTILFANTVIFII